MWRQARIDDGTTYTVWENRYNIGTTGFGISNDISSSGPAGHTNTENLSLIKLDNHGNYRALWQQNVGTDSSGNPIDNIFARTYSTSYGFWGSIVNMSSPCGMGNDVDLATEATNGAMSSNMRGDSLVAWQAAPAGTGNYGIWTSRCATFGCPTTATVCKPVEP